MAFAYIKRYLEFETLEENKLMKPKILKFLALSLAFGAYTDAAPMYSFPGTLAKTAITVDEFEKMSDANGSMNAQLSRKLFASFMRNSFQRGLEVKPIKPDVKLFIHFDSAMKMVEERFRVLEIRSTESPSIPIGFGRDLKVKLTVNDRDPTMVFVSPEDGAFASGKNYLLYFTDGKTNLYHAEFRVEN